MFSTDDHAAFEATWSAYQHTVDGYQADEPGEGNHVMIRLIETIETGLLNGLKELRKLGCTLSKPRDGITAYFDLPGTRDGSSEAINGLLEHLRGTTRGFRNLTY